MLKGNELKSYLEENKKEWYSTIEEAFIEDTLPQLMNEVLSKKDGLKMEVVSNSKSDVHLTINNESEKLRAVHFEIFEETGAEKDIICYIAAHSYNVKGDLVSRLILPFQSCLDDPYRLVESITLSL